MISSPFDPIGRETTSSGLTPGNNNKSFETTHCCSLLPFCLFAFIVIAPIIPVMLFWLFVPRGIGPQFVYQSNLQQGLSGI